jgi:hypothetical protein
MQRKHCEAFLFSKINLCINGFLTAEYFLIEHYDEI